MQSNETMTGLRTLGFSLCYQWHDGWLAGLSFLATASADPWCVQVGCGLAERTDPLISAIRARTNACTASRAPSSSRQRQGIAIAVPCTIQISKRSRLPENPVTAFHCHVECDVPLVRVMPLVSSTTVREPNW